MPTNVNSTDDEVSDTLCVGMPKPEQIEHIENGKGNETTHRMLPPEKPLGFLECIGTYRNASLFCLLAAVGILSDGYQVQMSGSIVALPGFIQTFGEPDPTGEYVINPQYLALWGSLKNVTSMLGGSLGSYPADRFGRKWCILVVQIVMIGSCILEQLSMHWSHWLGARLLDGFAMGLAQCCINVYISEMAPTNGRGALLSLVQLFYTIGSFLSAISLNIVTKQPPEQWRQAVLSQFALSGAAIVAWAFLPESPRWHCVQGHESQTKRILHQVNGKVEGYNVDQEYTRMLEEIKSIKTIEEIQGGGSYLDVFRGTNLRRLIISFLPWHWQIAIGLPLILTYSSYFYDKAGLANPFVGTVSTSAVTIVMLLVCIPLVERLGRRRLLITFAPVCIASLLIIGGVLTTSGPAVGPVLITMACIWNVGYSLSCGAMGYIYVAETATTKLRAKTTGLAIFGIQGMSTIYVYIAPIMMNSPTLGMSKTVFFWAGTGTLVYILVLFLVPETKGRSFAELDELFDRRIPAWKFAKTETQVDIQRCNYENLARA